jgi:hypothetical protein
MQEFDFGCGKKLLMRTSKPPPKEYKMRKGCSRFRFSKVLERR